MSECPWKGCHAGNLGVTHIKGVLIEIGSSKSQDLASTGLFVPVLPVLPVLLILSSDDALPRDICLIEQWSRAVAPTSSRGGLVLA